MSPDDIVAGSGVVLITTPGCSRCPSVRIHSHTVAKTSPNTPFVEVSAPDRPDLVTSLAIRAAPTALAFRDGIETARVVGPARPRELRVVFSSASTTQPQRRGTTATESRLLRTSAGAALVLAGVVAQVIWLGLIGIALVVAGWHDYLPRRSASTRRNAE